MEMEIVGDVASLDPDLLQLPEFSPLALKSNPFLAEQLFSLWLSLPETGRRVKNLLADVKLGILSFNSTGSSMSINVSTNNLSPSMFSTASTPPLSPRSTSGSPRVFRQRPGPFSLGSPLKIVSEPVREVIPQFYFKNGRPPPNELKEQCFFAIDKHFFGHLGLQLHEFKAATKDICKLPFFFSTTLFRKIDINNSGIITRMISDPFYMNFWHLIRGWSFYKVLLNFRRDAETVIYRIFYYINKSETGHLTLRELKRGNLIAAMQQVDEEEDINKVLRYFSYEHFYVIYCKFWELDTDHDFLIDKENLIRYGNHALTYRIVERIFSQVPRKFKSKVEGKMGYEDFVYFILSEEDKSSEPGLEFWFKCIDLDGNGVLTPNEMQFFYEEQLHRMECMTQEPVLFEDVLCQISDMIGPQHEGYITLRDMKGCKLSGNVFNILFNLNKFIAFESRDPFLIRQERENPTLTEWDRFAHREYIRLSMEEDVEDASNGSGDIWDESFESPF